MKIDKTEGDILLDQAIDALNDIAAETPEVIWARNAYMIHRYGSTQQPDAEDEERCAVWYTALAEFYSGLFMRAAAIQTPIETSIDRGLESTIKAVA